MHPEAVRWSDDGRAVDILDQTALPEREVRLRLESIEEVTHAVRSLQVRGAPAIGVTAALGLALEAARTTTLDAGAFVENFKDAADRLRATRPTAVNLPWAIGRMLACADAHRGEPNGVIACKLYGEATRVLEEDRSMCRAIGEHGAILIPAQANVLTHCNAGALATAGMGTALAPVYAAIARGAHVHVFADETRPLLQGSRITAWELQRAGIEVTVIADSVAASLFRDGRIDLVLVGADRIAANGDVVNKVGTYALAVLARYHGVPFFVAAPGSTIDPASPDGAQIPIEMRDGDEVRRGFGRLTAPADVPVYSPAFDMTPADLVTAIITETGVLRAPYAQSLRAAYPARWPESAL